MQKNAPNPSNPTPSKIAYDESKKKRLAKQKNTWAQIAQLPKSEQPQALFDAWPQKLPDVVFGLLNPDVLNGWRGIREDFHEDLIGYEMESIGLISEGQRLLMQIGRHGRKIYADQVEQVIGIAQSISGKKKLVLTLSHPDLLDEDDQNSICGTFFMNETGIVDDEFKMGLGLGLMGSGGLVIRQTLPLRVMVGTENGQQVWQHQEKVYGIFMSNGQWEALSDKDVKHSYCVDHQTGEAIEPPVGQQYGDLKSFLKTKSKTNRMH